MKIIINIIILITFLFSFEVEEQLSISELKDEAKVFILNQSYLDAISNYEKIYDIQSIIFGLNHKNLSETLVVLGDLYYKVDDEINALRCFQESIRIIHYNVLVRNQGLITPFEYLLEIYLNNEQYKIANYVSDRLSYLYSLDTLEFNDIVWSQTLNMPINDLELLSDNKALLSDSIIVETNPATYIQSALDSISVGSYESGVNFLLNAFIEGYDIFDYNYYNLFFNKFNDSQLNALNDFLQTLKYSDSQDIQAATYFYLAIISYELGSNNLALSYVNEFLRLMPEEIMGYIISANISFNQEKYIEALMQYQQILWLYPENYLALFQQGLCFYKLGYIEDAKLNFNKILINNPQDYNGTYYLGLIYYEDKNFEEAIKSFTSLLAEDSKNYKIYNFLGDAYYATDNLKRSLSAYKRSVKLNPYDANIYYKLGIIYEEILDSKEAIKNYNQAISLDNNEIDLIYRLGMILYYEGDLKISLEYLRRYIISNSNDIAVLSILGDILNKLNRVAESIDIYKKLIQLDPQNIEHYKVVAKLYWDIENYTEARYHYNNLLDLGQVNGEFYYYLGFIANQNLEFELAKNYLLYAIDCQYISTDLYEQLSIAYTKTKDFGNLIPLLHEALFIAPNNQQFVYYLGNAYYEIGVYDKSLEYLKQYYFKNEQDLYAAYLIGMSYFYNNNYIESKKYLSFANSNNDYETLYYLGHCSYHTKDYLNAIRFYKKSLIINPKNAYAIYSLGQSYINLNKKKEAKRQLRSLMNVNVFLFDLLQLAYNKQFNS